MASRPTSDDNIAVLLTGGHAATTGLAVIQTLREKMPQAKITWIGAKEAISGSKVTSLEHKIYPKMGINFFTIRAGKLQTKFTRYTIPLLLKIPLGFLDAFKLVYRINPRIIVSFGGFASFPVVFWGWVFKIPVILHEQTVAAGRAAMISAFFSRKIAIAREESKKYFPKDKVVVTGNPLLKEVLEVKPRIKSKLRPVVLIMGGSRGSEFINESVGPIAPKLTQKYDVIHITGERDFAKYEKLNSKNYKVFSFVDPKEMGNIYQQADIVVGRSGANSVAEMLYIKRPGILIPLPRTFMGEQYKNAKFAEDKGVAITLTEKEVTPVTLFNAIEERIKNYEKIVTNSLNYNSPDKDASENLTQLIMSLI